MVSTTALWRSTWGPVVKVDVTVHFSTFGLRELSCVPGDCIVFVSMLFSLRDVISVSDFRSDSLCGRLSHQFKQKSFSIFKTESVT
jgi:hypothetical protein